MSTSKSSSTSKSPSADDRAATRASASDADAATRNRTGADADAATSSDAVTSADAASAAKPVTYTYDRRRYVIDVLLPNYVSIVVLIAAVVLFALGLSAG